MPKFRTTYAAAELKKMSTERLLRKHCWIVDTRKSDKQYNGTLDKIEAVLESRGLKV